MIEALRRSGYAFWKFDEQANITYYENIFTGVIIAIHGERLEVIAA